MDIKEIKKKVIHNLKTRGGILDSRCVLESIDVAIELSKQRALTKVFREIDKICEKDRSGYIDSPEEDIINDLGELKKKVLE